MRKNQKCIRVKVRFENDSLSELIDTKYTFNIMYEDVCVCENESWHRWDDYENVCFI